MVGKGSVVGEQNDELALLEASAMTVLLQLGLAAGKTDGPLPR